ncbi:MAG TPA: KamA family radical SAM protein [Candidatus Magasanikbacteria bacterium]|nr:KamA family radical SAM protein [Candidatus Magasanikbacteria bacterium]
MKKINNNDPFLENQNMPAPKLIRRYENRALILVNNICARECAFCMRKRELIKTKYVIGNKEIKEIKRYLMKNKEIKELIFSGGDPLSTPEVLEKCLKELGNLSQIKIIRLGTRLPITYPKVINDKIIKILKTVKNKPFYLMLHVNHSGELNKDTVKAIKKLQTGVTMVLSQTVFLKGINDDVKILQELFEKLVEIGVKPYYLFHCDPVANAKPFEVDFKKEIKIYSELRKKLSGLAFPIFTIEAENSLGKIPVPTEFWNFEQNKFKDFLGKKFRV